MKTLFKLPSTALLLLSLSPAGFGNPHETWQTHGGDPGNTHYSSLNQINRSNVHKLTPAWTYASAHGTELFSSSELQVNPIVVDGILYGRNPQHHAFAIRADSGEELWTFDPFSGGEGLLGSYMRGVTYWTNGEDRRLFFNVSHFMVGLDARSGKPLADFGVNGRVDLRLGLGRAPETISVYAPSPGVIAGNLIILGSAVTEGEGAAPGDIRAYDVHSGKIIWTFHTIPHPGEPGHDTWPTDAWKTAGGANAWAGLSVDPDRSSRPGKNLFGNSIIALNARTGERLWHYQTIHHDLWDRDLSSPPTLVSVLRNGRQQAALAQASKQGVLYLLDRDTGKPIFPIAEVPVPASDVPGEKAWPTQPRVTLPEPFARQHFDEAEITDINPAATAHVKALYKKSSEFAYLRPPGLQPTIIYPGFYGGANWGGGAFDPESNIYYINATNSPHRVSISPVEVARGDQLGFGGYVYRKHCSGCHGVNFEGFYPYAPPLTGISKRTSRADASRLVIQGKGRMMPFGNLPGHERNAVLDYIYQVDREGLPQKVAKNTETETVYLFNGYADFLDDRGYPANKPPWGTLNAIDLNSGKRLWEIPLGEYAELTAEGVPPTGTRNYGGPVVTAGGVLFIAATSDEKLRAFDKKSGKLLWEYTLPAAGYATPATYMLDGVQYLVIVCSGGKLGTKPGDQYLAFRLPE
jgi:quinoprotein glucose dehydrogenase